MWKLDDFSWISVNHNGTSVIDWNTWTEYKLREGEKIIDRNVIWTDWKIESKIARWLIEITRDGVRELLTLNQYVWVREAENEI